jgi:hypothetical protein
LCWLLAVLPFQLARWRGADAVLNLGTLVPWLLFSAYWDNASRFFTLLLPFIAVLKARWLLHALSRVGLRSGAAVSRAIAITAVLLAALPAMRLIPRPTPYLDAAGFLSAAGAPRHLSTNSRLGEAYLGENQALPIPPSPAEVVKLRRQGWRFAVTDLQVLFGGFDRPERRYATAAWIAAHFPAVMEIPYSETALAQYIFEQDLRFQDALRGLAELTAAAPKLKVFDLSATRRTD